MSRRLACAAASVLVLACESAPRPAEETPTPVVTELPPERAAERDALLEELRALDTLSADALVSRRAIAHGSLSYDPLSAVNLDVVQGSALALDDAERERLGRDGFVITDRHRFPSFSYGYQTVYLEDLPVYISADAILEAIHRSYDDILKGIEGRSLRVALESMLVSMRTQLAGSAGAALDPTTRTDVDLYLAVALGLLQGEAVPCVAGGSDADVGELVAMATAHEGLAEVSLFGTARTEDMSQFEPRGHYADDVLLGRYFRAMMWLGRVDLRIVETQEDGTQVFQRRHLEAALGLRSVMDAEALARWTEIDTVVTAFVGEHDSMTLHQLDDLLADLGADDASDLDAISDNAIAQAILDGGYGHQRIASYFIRNGRRQGTLPLSSSFALFGQRYVVDSHVFSNVVYDRVQHGSQFRMMPSSLDVAYAALGNDAAIAPLAGELADFGYAPDLESMRVLVEAHGNDYWEQDLYTGWLGALRALSPHAGAIDESLPEVARTEAWGRRMLSTQLASWSELRHDTVLYAKQSYTTGAACEFPDGYVEPYPELFDRIAQWARIGREAAAGDPSAPAYFTRLEEIATTLADMARAQRTGTPFTTEQLAFINDAVTIADNCDGTTFLANGWYADLNFDRWHATEVDPTIVDVHTQPTDEAGAVVGRVLHVGTGLPRMAVFTFETCEGPRAYVGVVSSYFETITDDFERLTDDDWSTSITATHPADPAFLGDLVIR